MYNTIHMQQIQQNNKNKIGKIAGCKNRIPVLCTQDLLNLFNLIVHKCWWPMPHEIVVHIHKIPLGTIIHDINTRAYTRLYYIL